MTYGQTWSEPLKDGDGVKKEVFGIVALLVLAAAPVIAGEASANLSVSATIPSVCRVSTSAVSFGSYDPIGVNALVPLNASGAVTIACTKGSTATVGLGPGANASGSARRMRDIGSNLLTYELYKPSSADPGAPCLYGSPVIWTNISGGLFVPGAAPGKNVRSYSICAQVAAGQSLPAGGYDDIVLVTVNF